MPRKKAAKSSTATTEKMAPEETRAEPAPESADQNEELGLEEPGDSSIEADGSVEEINEDVPHKPAPQRNKPRLKHGHDEEGCHCYDSTFPRGKLPPPPILLARELEEGEKQKPRSGKDGIDKAMEMLDEYYEGVPLRDPQFDSTRED